MKNKNNNFVKFGFIGIILMFILLMMVPTNKMQLNGKDFLDKYNTTPNAVLMDVRTPDEFSAGHINGAIDVDYDNQSFESEIKKLDISKTYFVYCRSGNRSGKAITIMKTNGIKNIYELQGGIKTFPELIK